MPRPALALVQVAALERAARGRRDLRRQLELVVVESALAAEEDQHQPRPLAPRLLQRDGEQRASVGRGGRDSEPVAEAVVLAESPRRQHLAAARTERQLRRALAEVRRQPVPRAHSRPRARAPSRRSGARRPSRRRAPLRPPARPRRASPARTVAHSARLRSGRSHARSESAACSPRTPRHSEVRSRRDSRTPRSGAGRTPRSGRDRASRRRARRGSRRMRRSARPSPRRRPRRCPPAAAAPSRRSRAAARACPW